MWFMLFVVYVFVCIINSYVVAQVRFSSILFSIILSLCVVCSSSSRAHPSILFVFHNGVPGCRLHSYGHTLLRRRDLYKQNIPCSGDVIFTRRTPLSDKPRSSMLGSRIQKVRCVYSSSEHTDVTDDGQCGTLRQQQLWFVRSAQALAVSSSTQNS